MTSPSFSQLLKTVEQDDVRALAENIAALKKSAGQTDVNGRGLFHAAAHARAGDSLAWLLDNKIGDLDTPDNQGETPLMRAAWLGYEAGIAILLEGGAKIDAQSRAGGTPLHYAYAGGSEAKGAVSALLSAGADPSVMDKNGNPPEQWAQQALAREHGQALLQRRQVKAARPTLSISRPKV